MVTEIDISLMLVKSEGDSIRLCLLGLGTLHARYQRICSCQRLYSSQPHRICLFS